MWTGYRVQKLKKALSSNKKMLSWVILVTPTINKHFKKSGCANIKLDSKKLAWDTGILYNRLHQAAIIVPIFDKSMEVF